MTLKTDISDTLRAGATSKELSFTVVFREVTEESETYFVAECLEMPGCVSQGNTQQEAEKNMEDAMRLCLSVLFEDCLKQMVSRQSAPDLRGISSQGRLTIDPTPHLQYA